MNSNSVQLVPSRAVNTGIIFQIFRTVLLNVRKDDTVLLNVLKDGTVLVLLDVLKDGTVLLNVLKDG